MTDEIIIESIKKMIGLKMSDEDIIGSLMDADVDYDYATQMLEHVKYGKALPKENEIVKEMPIEEVEEEEPREQEKKNSKKNTELNKTDEDLGVWQEGIITTVNQKLDEISDKENKIEDKIAESVQKIASQEITKMKTIIESQRTLMIGKINSSLDLKAKEIEDKTTASLNAVQQINKQTQDRINELEEGRKKLLELQDTLKEQIDEFARIKDSAKDILAEATNNFTTNTTKKMLEFETRYNELDKKLNSTLNLATKILEGLVNATKKKLDEFYDKKADDFIKDLKERVEKTGSATTSEDIIKRFEELNKKLDEKISVKVSDAIDSTVEKTESLEDSIMDLNKRFAELERRITKGVGKTESDDRVDELVTFKEQYAKMMTKVMQDIKELKAIKEKKK